jgi:hypothetical protein
MGLPSNTGLRYFLFEGDQSFPTINVRHNYCSRLQEPTARGDGLFLMIGTGPGKVSLPWMSSIDHPG